MVLCNFQCRGIGLIWITVGQVQAVLLADVECGFGGYMEQPQDRPSQDN